MVYQTSSNKTIPSYEKEGLRQEAFGIDAGRVHVQQLLAIDKLECYRNPGAEISLYAPDDPLTINAHKDRCLQVTTVVDFDSNFQSSEYLQLILEFYTDDFGDGERTKQWTNKRSPFLSYIQTPSSMLIRYRLELTSQLPSADIISSSAHQRGDTFGVAPSGPTDVISFNLAAISFIGGLCFGSGWMQILITSDNFSSSSSWKDFRVGSTFSFNGCSLLRSSMDGDPVLDAVASFQKLKSDILAA
uniref:Uncharacterized protein n=1 Tax=Salix viminalis TaxID=40686 RepID=A0A6N2MBM0_SALVM